MTLSSSLWGVFYRLSISRESNKNAQRRRLFARFKSISMHAHLTLSTLDCQQIHSKYPIHPHTHTELTVIVCMTVRRAKRRTCFQPYLEADEAQLSHIIYHAVAIASLFVSHIFISPGHALCFGDNNNHSRGKQTRVKHQQKRR